MSKISILMPAYNAEKYISDAIQSVLEQTYDSWELVIVDDCSVDATAAICDKYAKMDNRIKVYHQTKNCGISRTKNKALAFATGNYIAFCDDDDVMHPDTLKDNIALIEKNNAEIVRWSYRTVKVNEENIITDQLLRKCKTKFYRNRSEIFDDYENVHELLSCDWTGLYSSKFLKNYQIKFNINYQYGGEDTEFNIRCLQHVNSMEMNDKVYYTWFLRKTHSTTAKRNVNFCYTMIEVAQKEFQLLRKNCKNYLQLWERYEKEYKKLIEDYCVRIPEKEIIVKIMEEKNWWMENVSIK